MIHDLTLHCLLNVIYFQSDSKGYEQVKKRSSLLLCLAPDCVIHRDPSIYPDFDVFRPERFLDESGKEEIAPPDTHHMGHSSFGFGRRYANVEIAIAS